MAARIDVKSSVSSYNGAMRVCIDRSSLGTPSSLIINDDGTFEWGTGEECQVCLFDRDRCDAPLEDLAALADVPLEHLSVGSEPQSRALASLGVPADSVPWFMALSREQFKGRITAISQAIQDVFRDHRLVEYVKTYGECRKFLHGLSRPTIDVDILEKHVSECDSGPSVVKTIKSFTPDPSGQAPGIVYSQIGSSTGRLTVTSGPSVLTLPKGCRDMIRSDGGSIYEVDFVSLEPRFVLHVMGRPAPKDIYADIQVSVLGRDIPRKTVKTATIAALYGSSSRLVAELTGTASSAKSITRRMKDYFCVDDLGRRLSAELEAGVLHNYYGRPLIDTKWGEKEPILVSHYVQSSCVDTALLGFSKLCDNLKSLGARPIYIIHDAVLIDVPRGADDRFSEVCASGVDLDVGHFELGVNKIS